MRLLNGLFHPINLLIVVVLVVLYLNRQLLFPEFSGSPDVQQLVGRVDNVIDSMDQAVTVAPDTPSNVTGKAKKPDAILPERAEATLIPQEGDRQEPALSQGSDEPQELRVAESGPTTSAGMDSADREAPESEEALRSEPAAPQDEASQPKSTGAEPFELWHKARQAAWANQPLLAIEHYRALIALQPNNYDAYGEMGNVMLRMGDRESAVDAYYRAAIVLNRSGYPQQAWQLLDTVARLDYAKGRELYLALRRQQSVPLWPEW